MQIITLTRGFVTKVDDADYYHLLGLSWHAHTKQGFTYARAPYGSGHVYLHVYLLKPPLDMVVDHINGDKLDNQRHNLRIATDMQNSQNTQKQKGRSSKYKGVVWDASRQKWKAQIKHENKNTNLGRFDSEEEAALAYDHAATALFGAFACINFPTTGGLNDQATSPPPP